MRTSYKNVAVGEISSLPGCAQVAVFHAAFVLMQHRSTGVGEAAHKDRLEKAKEALYDVGICTVLEKNAPQINILKATGWTQVWTFLSSRSDTNVTLWVRNL